MNGRLEVWRRIQGEPTSCTQYAPPGRGKGVAGQLAKNSCECTRQCRFAAGKPEATRHFQVRDQREAAHSAAGQAAVVDEYR